MKDLIFNILDCKWNNNWQGESKINQILQTMYSIIVESNDVEKSIDDLLKEVEEKEQWYGFELKDLLKEFFDKRIEWENFIYYVKEYCKIRNIKFNWHNYNIILNDYPFNYLNDFYSDFRGNIIKFHSIYNSKYVIVETEKNEDTYRFYLPGKCECFDSFEHALFYLMFGNHSSAVSLIFDNLKK